MYICFFLLLWLPYAALLHHGYSRKQVVIDVTDEVNFVSFSDMYHYAIGMYVWSSCIVNIYLTN